MRHRAAPSRRQLRRRRLNRRQRAVSLLLLVGLAAGAAIPCVMLQPWTAAAQTHARFDRSTALTRADLVETSRGVEREAGMWTLGESDEPSDSLTVRAANNPVVKALINGRDANTLPDGFNPDHATGGTGSMPASTLAYDRPQALSAIGFTKAGYSFTGWNTRKDGSGKTFTDKQTVSNLLTHEGASGTLYAQWTPTPPIVTVIFHVNNGGSDETVKRVWASNNLEMKTIDLPSGWSNSGFAFRGWNLKADGTGVEYEAGETLYGRLTAETTDLYADWNGLQTQLPNTGGILRHGLIGTLIAGMGLVVWTMGRRRARRR